MIRGERWIVLSLLIGRTPAAPMRRSTAKWLLTG
jgi:hypothetical protein